MEIHDNIKERSTFERVFYYNIGNSTQLKKEKKYTPPKELAMSKKSPKDIGITHSTKGRGERVYYAYGGMTKKELKGIWKEDNNLFEIIEDKERKPYFDIDKKFNSDEKKNNLIWKKTIKQLQQLLKNEINIDIYDREKTAFCEGKGTKDGYFKYSAHIIINNGFIFKNKNENKMFMEHLKRVIMNDNKYELLREDVLDFAPYGNNQDFKLPYQSKVNQNIIQIPKENYLQDLKHYLVGYTNKSDKLIDISKFKVKSEKITITNAKGEKKQVSFNIGEILQSYKECFEPKFQVNVKQDENMSDLEYLLKSIPNNKKVSFKIWKIIGYCISKTTENSKEGLKLWCEWTKPYKAVSPNDLSDIYYQNSTTNGYGWDMLEQLAKIFNINSVDIKGDLNYMFDDKPKYKHDLIEFDTHFNSEGYDIKKTVDKYDILSIKARMGCGKSYDLSEIFKEKDEDDELKYKKVLYFSCNRAFCASMIKDFEKHGFVSYMDKTKNFEYCERVIVSVESLCKVKNTDFDLVIIDECETIFSNLTGEMNLKNSCLRNLSVFYNIMNNSKKLFFMDAYLSQRTYKAIEDIFKDDLMTKKMVHIHNKRLPKKRIYRDVSKHNIFGEICDKLNKGETAVLCSGSNTLIKQIKEDIFNEVEGLTEDDILVYDAQNPLPLGTNLNEKWKNKRLIMYSPTITAGISYTNEDWVFDNLFIYSVNVYSCLYRDTIQAHKRIRNFKNDIIHIAINDQFDGYNRAKMPIRRGDLKRLQDFKNKLFDGDDIEELRDRENMAFMYNIYMYNELEKNINTVCFKDMAMKYLERENIHKFVGERDIAIIQLDNYAVEELDYNTIENITRSDKIKYTRLMENGEFHPDQCLKVVKHNYNEDIKKDIEENVKKRFFNKVYCEKKLKEPAQNVKNFKRFLHDIKYDVKNIKDHKGVINNEVLTKELYDTKYKLYSHIFKIMKSIGMIKNNKVDINNDVLNTDFNDELITEYSKIDLKTINSMFKSYHSLKRSTSKFGMTQMKALFNNLLKEAFKIEMFKTGQKTVYNEGKKSNIGKCGFRWWFDKNEKSDNETLYYGGNKYLAFNIYKDNFTGHIE